MKFTTRERLPHRQVVMILDRFMLWMCSLLDSEGLDTTEYVERIERHFGIVIQTDKAEPLATLGDLCRLILRSRSEQDRPLSEQAVWDEVQCITSDEFGIRADELRWETRYVEDLNC